MADNQEAPILTDSLYLLCMSLARMSKSDGERYGSIARKDGSIIGMGYNRAIAHPYIHLERTIRMGYANHAEIEAMDDAIRNGADISGADIYCAGYFPEPHTGFLGKNRLLIKEDAWYTCVKCPPHMEKYGIANIYVPTPSGWAGINLAEAETCAHLFTGGTHEKRISVISTSFTIDEIAADLVDPASLHIC
jgi:hypothetical protein